MAEEESKKEDGLESSEEEAGKKGGWSKALALIPLDKMATPAGMIGLALIGVFELLQAVLIPSGGDLVIETLIHVLLIAFLAKLFDKNVKQEVKKQLVPLLVGLVPFVSDYIPEVILMNVILPFIL